MNRYTTLLLFAAAAPALADVPGAHPAYLHARSNLHVAERIMMSIREEPNVMNDLGAAIERVRQAIRLIDQAAVIDRKDVVNNPPIDTYPDRRGRFRAMYQMLEGAKRDLSQAEANLSAVGWRNAAIGKVNEAEGFVKRAARDDWRDDFGYLPPPPPPRPQNAHYVQAISDLRLAKALLWRRDFSNVMADQREAIREIDEAIREAGAAAITDGKDPNYQPAVDVNLRPADRLTRATEALNSALRNLSFEEDNRGALAWRQASIRDVQHAKGLVERAIHDKKVDLWFSRW
jgi:tetratricopeptide (TPR) repeat protein